MGTAQRVVAVFLVQAHLPLFRLRESAGAQRSVIVMDAGSAKDHSLAVDGQAFFGIPGQRTDSEGFLHHILTELYPCRIKVGVVRAPELCPRNLQEEYRLIGIGDILLFCQNLFSVQDLYIHLSRL